MYKYIPGRSFMKLQNLGDIHKIRISKKYLPFTEIQNSFE